MFVFWACGRMGPRRLLGSPKRHVCSSTAYFHVTFMNSRYVQIEVCYTNRNSHISGMLTLVCFFVHVQMETQICGNSWYYPPPLTHALLSFACFTLRSGMRNGLLTSSFSLFVQGVRLASPSSLLPAEPFSKGLVLYVCFAHLAQVCVD